MENVLSSEDWPLPHASGIQQKSLPSETVIIVFVTEDKRMKMSGFYVLVGKKNLRKKKELIT